MEKIKIITSLPSSRWKEYRDLKNKAFRDHSEFFGYSKIECYQEIKDSALWKKELGESQYYDYRIFFAENQNGELVGTIRTEIRFDFSKNLQYGYISMLFVVKEYRQMAIATSLLNTSKIYCKVKKMKEVRLICHQENLVAIHLYEKHGFVKEVDAHKERVSIKMTLKI